MSFLFKRINKGREKRLVSVLSKSFLKEFMKQMQIVDLRFYGNLFTWFNRKGGLINIKECIDHMLTNSEWIMHFSKTSFVHQVVFWLNHSPLQFHCLLISFKNWSCFILLRLGLISYCVCNRYNLFGTKLLILYMV